MECSFRKFFESNGHEVGVVLVKHDETNSVLILRRGPTAPWMPGVWNLPGGGVEDNETPQDAARRECHEEAGINPGNLIPVTRIDGHGYTMYAFLCHVQTQYAKIDWESDKFTWVTTQDLDKYHYVPGVRDLISKVLTKI